MDAKKKHEPGQGLRQIKSTIGFRVINFELYTKPNKIIMGIGLLCISAAFGYITYLRAKYESMGYYVATKEDGKEVFTKKESKWNM